MVLGLRGPGLDVVLFVVVGLMMGLGKFDGPGDGEAVVDVSGVVGNGLEAEAAVEGIEAASERSCVAFVDVLPEIKPSAGVSVELEGVHRGHFRASKESSGTSTICLFVR